MFLLATAQSQNIYSLLIGHCPKQFEVEVWSQGIVKIWKFKPLLET